MVARNRGSALWKNRVSQRTVVFNTSDWLLARAGVMSFFNEISPNFARIWSSEQRLRWPNFHLLYVYCLLQTSLPLFAIINKHVVKVVIAGTNWPQPAHRSYEKPCISIYETQWKFLEHNWLEKPRISKLTSRRTLPQLGNLALKNNVSYLIASYIPGTA